VPSLLHLLLLMLVLVGVVGVSERFSVLVPVLVLAAGQKMLTRMLTEDQHGQYLMV
jgi:hypothetical protein